MTLSQAIAPIRLIALMTLLAAALLSAAISISAQIPTMTPIVSDDPPPTQPEFSKPIRPLPRADRVGVDAVDQLSLTIEQAIEMALQNNNDIDATRNDAIIFDFRLTGTKGLYDPLISSDSYYEKLSTPTASAIGGAVNGAVTQTRYLGNGAISGLSPYLGGSYSAIFNSSRTTTSNTNSFLNPQFPSSLSFSYTQPLLRDRKIDSARRQVQIAKKNQKLSDSELQLRAINVVAGVEQAYWDLTFTLRNLQVENDALKQAREQLESNKRLVAKGVLAPIEIVAANAQIANYEQAIYVTQENVTRAENALKSLILTDRTSTEWSRPLTPISATTVALPQISLESSIENAFKNRPEIAQLKITSEINTIDEKYYRDQTKMQFDLTGTYTSTGLSGTETPAAINPITGLSRVPPNLVGRYGTSLGNLLQQDYPSYRIGLTFSMPWGNRIAKANLGESLVTAKRIENSRAQTEQVIEAEVRNAMQALRSSSSRLDSATAAREAAEELYASEERLFRQGTTTFYLVGQRQTDFFVARILELRARTDLNKAISEYYRVTGSTLEVNGVTVSK